MGMKINADVYKRQPFPEPENPDTTIKIPFLFTLFPPIRYSVSVL